MTRRLRGDFTYDPSVAFLNPDAVRWGLTGIINRLTDEQILEADLIEVLGFKVDHAGNAMISPVTYDYIEDIDDAIIELLGVDPWAADRDGDSWSSVGSNRHQHMERAMAKALREGLDNAHPACAVLIAGWRDLERTGAFQPKLGWNRPN